MQAILVLYNQMPLCFRRSRSDKSAETLLYVPGTALLGGLAQAHHLLERKKEEFGQFFTKGKIWFGNLYPANFATNGLLDEEQPVHPVPSTAHSCKRFAGFWFNYEMEEDEERHGVDDHLIIRGLFALSGQQNAQMLKAHDKCSFSVNGTPCGQLMSPYSGFYRRGGEWKTIGSSRVARRVLTRTGISRRRGAVSQGTLYNREALVEGQTFWGALQCEDELWDDFQKFFEEASDAGFIRLGNNRTRGLGNVSFKYLQPWVSGESSEMIEERIISFTEKIGDAARLYEVSLPHSFYIPITLQSDVILKDELMSYRTALDGAYFEDVWGLAGLERVYHAASTRRVMGWNAFLGLPKADDVAIQMGSVFLFGLKNYPDETFWQKLFKMETKGIGERQNEGFGQFTIADPFHTEAEAL